jgi:hypothetical protein
MTAKTKERVEFIKVHPKMTNKQVRDKYKISSRQAGRLLAYARGLKQLEPYKIAKPKTNTHSLKYEIPTGYVIDSFQTAGKTLIVNFIQK